MLGTQLAPADLDDRVRPELVDSLEIAVCNQVLLARSKGGGAGELGRHDGRGGAAPTVLLHLLEAVESLALTLRQSVPWHLAPTKVTR